jgi:PAS domain S-box-containing protein
MAESDEDLRFFAESMADVARESLIALDKTMHVVWANRAFYKKFEISKEHTIGKSIYELGNDLWNIPKLRELLETAVLSQSTTEGFEIKHHFESIGEKVMVLNAKRSIDEKGNLERILLAIEDVTELDTIKRKLDEQPFSFRECRRVLDAIMRYVPAGIILVDKEAKITDVSSVLVKMTGVPEEELIGQVERTEVWGVLEPQTRKPLPFQSMPLFRVVNEKKIISDEEYLLVHDGQERVIAISAGPVLDEKGSVSGAVSIWYDITRRKAGQAARRESEERFRTLADSISQLTWMANPEGEMFWYNKRWYEFTGADPEQMKSEDWKKNLHPDYVEKVSLCFRKAIKNGSPWECTFPMRSKEGEYRWFLARAISIRNDSGKIVRWLGTCTDVSDIRRYKEEIQISAERFRRIVSTDIVGVAIADSRGGISYLNDYCLNVLGYGREEFESRKISWVELTPPEYLNKDYKAIEELNVKGSTPSYEKQFIKKDGSRVWAHIAFTILPGPGEQLFVFVLDITDRKRALAEAQKRSVEVETIFNSLPDGLVILNSDGSVFRINNIASDMFGVPDRAVNWPHSELIKNLRPKSPDGKPLEVEQLPSYRALHGETVRNSIIMVSKADRDYWISESASPISIDGQVIGAIMEFSDVTALHNLQDRLAGERNFIDAILKSSGALIVVFDKNGLIIRFNKACEILSGYSEQEVINRSFYPLIPPEEHEKVRNVLSRLLSGETLIENENNWFTKSGEKRFIRWRNTVINNEQGEVSYYVATGIDITDRILLEEELNKRAHELAAANADLESFSYSVSHDLRSPLAAISSLSSIMIEDYADRLDEEGRDFLQRIHDGTKKMMHLIEDMLSLSRVGRHEMKRVDIDLSEMVGKFLEEFRNGSPQREVEFMVQKDVHVYADTHLLYIAVENLLRNAWKFTSKKPVTVIEFGTVVIEGEVTCYIKDNGAGFDQKFGEIIFEPFMRAPGEKEFGGTGVGLSIVKRVIDRHGGKVWAKGEAGKGAVFYFTVS